jgi:hypothetical protein
MTKAGAKDMPDQAKGSIDGLSSQLSVPFDREYLASA